VGDHDERAWLLREWEQVLADLERDVSLTGDRVDWVAKRNLLGALQAEEELSWTDPWLQAIDLEYHSVAEDGLHYELVRRGAMRRFVTEDEIAAAIVTPPETTRAYFRGRAVARFGEAISALQWDEIVFREGKRPRRVALPEVAEDERLTRLNAHVRDAETLELFLRGLAGL
ncbi:MAG: proteasome accessory factor PafA2 family protein, partial [Chthoniobacterales bacterium]